GMRFRGLFRSGDSSRLGIWIDEAVNSGLVAIARFARVLRRDIDAVHNAIELPWSNGQAEGQINRLKTIKRAMYGRAGPELLRARMLPPQPTARPHKLMVWNGPPKRHRRCLLW
ncbi:transposase, partial [Sinorhizobium sp. CCBAU 05631]